MVQSSAPVIWRQVQCSADSIPAKHLGPLCPIILREQRPVKIGHIAAWYMAADGLLFFQGYLEQDLWLATPPLLRTLSALSVDFQVIKAAVSVAGLLWPATATPKRYNSSVCLCTSHCYQLMSLNERQTPLNLKINMVGPQLINIALTNPHQAPKEIES